MFYKVMFSAITFFLFSAFTSQAQSNTSYDAFTVHVEGLGCPFCAYGLEKKFKEFKGLKKPTINMETGKFTFQFPSKEALSIERVEKQVESAGYTAVRVQIERANGQLEDSKTTITTVSNTSKTQEAQIPVAGNCGMCKARIEKAAQSLVGVQAATWEAKKQRLSVRFDPSKTDLATIAKRVAKSGHDADLEKASNNTYRNLPACCLYQRP